MCWVLQLKSKWCDNVGMMQLKIYVVTTLGYAVKDTCCGNVRVKQCKIV